MTGQGGRILKARIPRRQSRYIWLAIIPGDAEPDIAVAITGRIVQIQRQDTCVAAIVPIATAKEATEGH